MKNEECNSLMSSFSIYTRSEEENDDLSLVGCAFICCLRGACSAVRYKCLLDLPYDLQQTVRFLNGHEVNFRLEL